MDFANAHSRPVLLGGNIRGIRSAAVSLGASEACRNPLSFPFWMETLGQTEYRRLLSNGDLSEVLAEIVRPGFRV